MTNALIQPDLVAPAARRACRHCEGTGRNLVLRWVRCSPCRGSGTVAPLGHYDARGAIESDDYQEGDGCDRDHTHVLRPCRVCGKAPADLRHLCRLLEGEKPCAEHHEYAGAAMGAFTREGCLEHGVTFAEVERWRIVATTRGQALGLCWCCLGPSPMASTGVPRDRCYRCRPHEGSEA